MIPLLASSAMTKGLAIAAGAAIVGLSISTYVYKTRYEFAVQALAVKELVIERIKAELARATQRAAEAEERVAIETARLVSEHKAKVKDIERRASERERKLRADLQDRIAALRSCPVPRDVVVVLNEPADGGSQTGDGSAAPAAGTGSAATPYPGAEAGPSCADLAVWAGQLRDAKEANDRQIIDLQQFYNSVREQNNRLFK